MNNIVSLVGRLTRNINIKYLDNDKKVANFNLAVNSPYKDKDGNRTASFIACTVWGKTAENIAKYCNKGSLIGIEGRLQSKVYLNKHDENTYSLWVNVTSFSILESKNKSAESPSADQHKTESTRNNDQNYLNQESLQNTQTNEDTSANWSVNYKEEPIHSPVNNYEEANPFEQEDLSFSFSETKERDSANIADFNQLDDLPF
ncbi:MULTISPECIES: single-stranded DNA-binding protein [Aerococcus]|uniref:single-stranded DNA-binding protein n=1 Tax=Aerococcus TaxID=1375 RepID=UPI0018A7436A|nr:MULTISPECIES: single-stranded DNA-binding protein [Aerococcus]MCY3067621.1 single-stranded DNA-binding protein [Aerococcus mictus]MCY3080477.1 single-stranded DNA-binding protein [Aerococcus mictus]MDK8484540.1 single-stranded DNA-binding protein [Aerococcus urinae]